MDSRDSTSSSDAHGESSCIGPQDIIATAILFLTALLIRLYLLRSFDVISTDGTSYARAALALKSGDVSGISVYGFYPVLIWLANILVTDVELAGRLVSVTFGSLLVVPLYLLGTALYSRPVAIAACLVSMVWPSLLGWSCEVMTQATYTTLVIGGVYLVWRMFRDNAPTWGCAAGALLGLAYLTRPEGILILLAAPLAPYLLSYRELPSRWRPLAGYLGSFLLLFCLNIVLVRQATGHWQLSAKTGSALTDALQYYLGIPDMNYIPNYQAKGYLDLLRDYPGFLSTNIIKNSREALQTMLPIPLWLLAIAGFLTGGFSRMANIRRLFLLATFTPLLVIVAFYYIGPEYTQPYLPVLLVWAGAGVISLGDALVRKLKPADSRWPARVTIPTVTIVAAAFFMGSLLVRQLPARATDTPYNPEMDGGRRDQKNVGLILKQQLPPGKIMTRWARIAFYAEREWVNIPNTSHDEIMKAARASKVRFLIVDGELINYRPGLSPELFRLFGPEFPQKILSTNTVRTARVVPGLLPYFIYRDPSSTGVAVYEIVPD
ncbi:MAG TPA: glycosyltransferase family 39 protein [Geobacteraceae bacterium]